MATRSKYTASWLTTFIILVVYSPLFEKAVCQDDVRRAEQNVVASRLVGKWKVEPTLNERLTGSATALIGELEVSADPEAAKKFPAKYTDEFKRRNMEIYMAGVIEMRGTKHPFILTALFGNPHVFYLRERGGDPFGDAESFNVMLVRAKSPENDLLFIGGDFNNQAFRAYSRARAEKE